VSILTRLLLTDLGATQGDPSQTLLLLMLNMASATTGSVWLGCPAIPISCSPSGHNLTVIEADGILTEPHVVDSLQVFAGQRYSVIMNATQPIGNYWIRALPNVPFGANFAGGLNSAILRYSGAPNQDSTTNHTTGVIPLLEQ